MFSVLKIKHSLSSCICHGLHPSKLTLTCTFAPLVLATYNCCPAYLIIIANKHCHEGLHANVACHTVS